MFNCIKKRTMKFGSFLINYNSVREDVKSIIDYIWFRVIT